MYLKTLCATLTAFASLQTPTSYSLESDADAEITIQSDRAELDRKSGTAVYSGNVVLEQGTLLINADQITLYSNQNQQLNKAVAKGKPAHFQQQMEGDKGLTKAQGHIITYLTLDKNISLLKEAVLEQEGNSFSGNQITYDIINESVSAKGQAGTQLDPTGEQPSSRIKMIIQPAKPAETKTNEDA